MAYDTKYYLDQEGLELYDSKIKEHIDKKIVQSDWEQNDDAAADYIKNRTHYEKYAIVDVTSEIEVMFDSTTKQAIVSDKAVEGDLDLDKASLEHGKEYIIVINEIEQYPGVARYDRTGVGASGHDAWSIGDKNSSYYIDYGILKCTLDTVPTNPIKIKIQENKYILKTLDEKYIPDTIARLTDVPELPNIPALTWDNITNKPSIVEGTDINAVILGGGAEASGPYSLAEGKDTIASGPYSHAEGKDTIASGSNSHAEGNGTVAFRGQAHAEGNKTTASGNAAHAEGSNTIASAAQAHAEGRYTIAASSAQHAQGKYNIEDAADRYAHIVGNGTSDTARSNAHTLDWDGNGWYAGNLYVGGTSQDDATRVATIADIANSKYNQLVMTDAENGYDYILEFRGGKLASYCAATAISVTTGPDKISYFGDELFDPTGMIITATCQDGTTREITNYTYSPSAEPPITTSGTITITYTENGKTFTTTYNCLV